MQELLRSSRVIRYRLDQAERLEKRLEKRLREADRVAWRVLVGVA